MYYLYLIILIIVATILLIIIDEIVKYHNKKEDKVIIINNKKKKCKDICDERVCNEYENRLSNYHNCLYCKTRNMCFSEPQGECIECSRNDLKIGCEAQDRFGCENQRGFIYEDIPPIDPVMNNCKMCWQL
jgi:hypothetical protein